MIYNSLRLDKQEIGELSTMKIHSRYYSLHQNETTMKFKVISEVVYSLLEPSIHQYPGIKLKAGICPISEHQASGSK